MFIQCAIDGVFTFSDASVALEVKLHVIYPPTYTTPETTLLLRNPLEAFCIFPAYILPDTHTHAYDLLHTQPLSVGVCMSIHHCNHNDVYV